MSVSIWRFPIIHFSQISPHKPSSYWGTPMAMETPISLFFSTSLYLSLCASGTPKIPLLRQQEMLEAGDLVRSSEAKLYPEPLGAHSAQAERTRREE